jgi:hypothetical protein
MNRLATLFLIIALSAGIFARNSAGLMANAGTAASANPAAKKDSCELDGDKAFADILTLAKELNQTNPNILKIMEQMADLESIYTKMSKECSVQDFYNFIADGYVDHFAPA